MLRECYVEGDGRKIDRCGKGQYIENLCFRVEEMYLFKAGC